jgi:hypothetical protein
MTRQDYIALCERKIQEAREELSYTASQSWEDSSDCNSDEDDSERDHLHRQINWHELKLRELRG